VDLGIDDRHRESSSISLASSVPQQVVRSDFKRLFVLDASRTRGQFSALLGVYSKLRYGFHSASMARDNQWHNPIKPNLANACPRAASRRPGLSKSGPPHSWCVTQMGRRLSTFFSRISRRRDRRQSYSAKTKHGGSRANIAKLPDLLLGL
jgi:hypothetical protein